jgi:hypothetical protein
VRKEHSIRRRVAGSRLSRAAALPVRARGVLSYDARMVRRQVKWLATSREHTNLTLPLDPANEEHLAWFVAHVTAQPVATIHGYLQELRDDAALRDHIRQVTLSSPRRGLADPDARYGRRMGWYALTRALRPARVVESGVDKGLGSVVIAAALGRNAAEGSPGRLTAIDISADAGFLITGRYADLVDRRLGSSLDVLADIGPVDIFIHDSDHDPAYEQAELDTVEPWMTEPGVLISDNPSGVLPAYAERTHRQFLFFQERPHYHWAVGEGFGVAWPAQRNTPLGWP